MFALAGVKMPDRVTGFFKPNGTSFSAGCAVDCSFMVGESGVAAPSFPLGPGIEFKLSRDGSFLTATCKAVACTIVTATIGEYLARPNVQTSVRRLKNSENLDLSTTARALFYVEK